MSEPINPLDHVSNPFHSLAELIMKWACPELHPARRGEVSLHKEVPTHKMFSPGLSQGLTGKDSPREEPFATSEDKLPQKVQERLRTVMSCLLSVLCDVRDIA